MREWHYIAPKRRKQGLRARILHAETQSRPSYDNPAEKTLGVVEWFRVGEYERVEHVLADLKALGVQDLRTSVSWADWCTREGQAWYSWLFPRLAEEVSLLPCFLYTPPSLGVVSKTSSPPHEPKAYADFLDLMITRFGAFFEQVELWNQPSNLFYWDWRLDPEWWIFSEMVGGAAYWARQRGKKTVLAGMCPTDPHWLAVMCERGVMQYIDAVGVHAFPGTWECDWNGWSATLAKVWAVLEIYKVKPQVWITETGFSTWRHDERGQLQALVEAIAAPVKRVYWYSAYDLHPDLPHQHGFHADERHYHFGLKRADGVPKLLFRLGASNGLTAVRDVAWLESSAPRRRDRRRPVLITGGAGFIGTNLADRLLSSGRADQYIMDYTRTFPIPMVVFRMSCIYGPHQFGTEDQGWVAHFLIRTIAGQPITLYGDGMQVRDILFVDDLIEALLLAQAHMPRLSGQAFNIGGGPAQAVSLLELIDLIAEVHGDSPVVHFADWRPGDQRYYVSDTRRFRAATGWAPQVGVRQGLRLLYQWLLESRGLSAACPAVGKVAS